MESYALRLEDRISRHIVDSAIEVHRNLGGPGLLESVYEEALVWELNQRDLIVERQVDLPIFYKGTPLSSHFRIDLVIDGKVIVECKTVSTFNPHFSQGFVARRCKRMWMQGLRPRTPETYFKYVEESDGA